MQKIMEEYEIMEYLELTVIRCGRWMGNREVASVIGVPLASAGHASFNRLYMQLLSYMPCICQPCKILYYVHVKQLSTE